MTKSTLQKSYNSFKQKFPQKSKQFINKKKFQTSIFYEKLSSHNGIVALEHDSATFILKPSTKNFKEIFWLS